HGATAARGRGDDRVVGGSAPGRCVLAGVTHDDSAAAARKRAEKVWPLRVFDDAEGVMNLPLSAVGGGALVVSQFTLYGDTRRGRRPSWAAAAPPDRARGLVEAFARALRDLGATVASGEFAAHMQVELVNDGP